MKHVNKGRYRLHGKRVPFKKWGTNWGEQCKDFVHMITYLKNQRGIVDKELMLMFYKLQHPQYWMTRVAWSQANYRFFLEQALTWLRVYKRLESCNSRHEFLALLGLNEEELRDLLPAGQITREHFSRFAEWLGKQEELKQVQIELRKVN